MPKYSVTVQFEARNPEDALQRATELADMILSHSASDVTVEDEVFEFYLMPGWRQTGKRSVAAREPV